MTQLGSPFEIVQTVTVTVAAGGTAEIETDLSLGDKVMVALAPATDPNGDVSYEWRVKWDDSEGDVDIVINEALGLNQADVDVTVFRSTV